MEAFVKFQRFIHFIVVISLVGGACTFGSERSAQAAGEAVSVAIDVNANRKSISPYIYGLNFAKESFADEIDLPLRRWGGNTTSRYNWQTDNANTADDWYYENNIMTNAYDWNVNEGHNAWIAQNKRTGTDSIITIPMLGYVAKDDSSCSFSVTKYGAQTDTDTWRPDCGNGILPGGSFVTNDPLDASVAVNETFMQNWIQNLVATHGSSTSGGVRFYALDNEPELWSETHRDVHPSHQTYAELLAKTLAYAPAIKAADPNAQLLGYVAFGWTGYWYSYNDTVVAASNGYTYFPDYAAHGNMYQVEWYLDQMHQYQQTNGVRLLDYLDLHYYPESGVSLTTVGDLNTQALRLRSTRSLWDPTYRDESWIGGDDQAPDQRYVRLIPRMRDWVNTYYPGTKLAITEYNFGGLEHINGALTQADTLGIFGREGLDLAALWNYPYPNDPLGYYHFETLPGAYAFRMYRNYNGTGGKFGDVSVSTVSSDSSKLSAFAAERNADGSLTVMFINKTSAAITGNVSLANFTPHSLAEVYRYSAANLNAIPRQPDLTISGASFTYNFPASSITLIVIPESSGPVTYQSTFTSAATQDGWVLESNENSNIGGKINALGSTFDLGDNAQDKQYRVILSFNTSSLPDNAVVTKLTLRLRKQTQSGDDPFNLLGGLTVDIAQPSFGRNSLEIGDFQAAASASQVGEIPNTPVDNWYSQMWNSASFFSFINRTGLTQFRLRFLVDDNDDLGADFVRFYSGNASAVYRPQLIVEYYLP